MIDIRRISVNSSPGVPNRCFLSVLVFLFFCRVSQRNTKQTIKMLMVVPVRAAPENQFKALTLLKSCAEFGGLLITIPNMNRHYSKFRLQVVNVEQQTVLNILRFGWIETWNLKGTSHNKNFKSILKQIIEPKSQWKFFNFYVRPRIV